MEKVKLFVMGLIVLAVISLPVIKGIDYFCMSDCLRMGYSYQYCENYCSY